MAYFDNAATTYPKPEEVYSFMDSFYRQSGGNAGRGNYSLARTAGSLIADTRKRLQEILHCPAKQVVFTPTATLALNIVIQGILATGAHNVYISPFEHNAVARMLHLMVKKYGIALKKIPLEEDGLDIDIDKM